ncbi:putative lipid II flippase FtsW [Rhizobiaceae bacterium]|nr:putative lipid II flippase FtsW [Rhizobiaceae bacterium]
MAHPSRADRSRLSEWWWTIDKSLLAAALALIAAGFFLSLSSSPAATARLKIDNPFYFMERHAMFAVLTVIVLVGVSALSPRWAKRLCLVGLAGTLVILLALPFVGFSAKGSTRWLALGGFLLQPSEFLKPFFVVVTAWLFAEGQRQRDVPTTAIAIALFGLCATLLIIQPDFGQTVLLATVWAAMFFLAGISLWIVGLLGGLGVAGAVGAYTFIPHVTTRFDRFITGAGDNFQVDRGFQAIESGGWLGRGPGEGLVKRGLPDSHTDFIFSVAAEEYGIIVVMGLVAVFFFIMLRGLFHAMRERDRFVQLAVAGLVLQFGLQATINICVNLQLAPAKGMTLPFVSYGGSSMVAVAIGMGLVLALTRRRSESLRRLDVRIRPATNMVPA